MRIAPTILCLQLIAAASAQINIAVSSNDPAITNELGTILGNGVRSLPGPEFSSLGQRADWSAAAARLTDRPAPFLLVFDFQPSGGRDSATSTERGETCTVTLLSCRLGQVALTHQEAGTGRGGTADVAARKARKDLLGKLSVNLPTLLRKATGAPEWNTFPCQLVGVPTTGLGNLSTPLEEAIRRSGLSISARVTDASQGNPSYQLTLDQGTTFPKATAALSQELRTAGLDAFFAVGAQPAGTLTITFTDPRREIVVKVDELDEPRETSHGGKIVTVLQEIPGMQVLQRLYDGTERTWTLRLLTHYGAAAVDSLLAHSSESPARKHMVLLALGDDVVTYRMRNATQTLHVEVLNVPTGAMLAAGSALDGAMQTLAAASDYLRRTDTTQRTFRLQLRYHDTLQNLEQGMANILRTLQVPGDLRPTVPSFGNDLAFEYVDKSRLLLVRLEGLPTPQFQTIGEAFVDALRAMPSTTVTDRRFDTAANRVEVTLSVETKVSDVDRLIWAALAKNKELAPIAPDTSDGNRRNFVWGDAAGAATVPVVLVGMSQSAMTIDGGAFVTMLRSLDGVTSLEARFAPDLQELAIDVRTRMSAPALEAAILAANTAPLAERILPAGRQGKALQFRLANRTTEQQKHVLYLHADLAKTNEEARAALTTIVKGLPGASDVVTADSDRALDVHFLSQNPPPVVHDDLLRSMREERRLEDLAILQLDGQSILLGQRGEQPRAPAPAPAGAPATPVPAPPRPATTTPAPEPAPSAPAVAVAPSLADVVERAMPSVVHIDAECGGSSWLGSGFVVSSRGLVMTNQHVAGAPEGKSQSDVRLVVKTNDGKRYPARYLAGDAEKDLALLRIDAEGLRPVTFGDSDRLRIGESLLVIGSGHGYEFSVTTGILSARRNDRGWLQTDALTNPGNSGGPAFDQRGNVIGVCVAGSVSRVRLGSEKLVIPHPGINFLIEGKLANQFLSAAISTGSGR